MNFEHLKCIISVARNGSISAAARELFVSQPYLSGMISKIEKELGYAIFIRTSRSILPTEEGLLFLNSANIILRELDKINSLSDKSGCLSLRVAAYYSSFFMKLFLRFRSEISDCPSDTYVEMGNEEAIRSVSEGKASLGIICYAPSKHEKYAELASDMHCRIEKLIDPFPLYIFASEQHEIARRGHASTDDLRHYRYVCYNDGSSLRYLNILGIETKSDTLRVSNRGGLMDAITSGGYITISSMLDAGDYPGTVLIPLLNHRFFLNTSAVFREDYAPTDREKDFLSYMNAKTREVTEARERETRAE